MTETPQHVAYPGPAIIAMFPTRGGWRGQCADCRWLGKTHRSEREAEKDCRRHVREVI